MGFDLKRERLWATGGRHCVCQHEQHGLGKGMVILLNFNLDAFLRLTVSDTDSVFEASEAIPDGVRQCPCFSLFLEVM